LIWSDEFKMDRLFESVTTGRIKLDLNLEIEWA